MVNQPVISARARGFEPRSKVLETSILPLNYARKNDPKLKSQKGFPLTFYGRQRYKKLLKTR